MHLSRLRGRKVNELVLSKGERWNGKTMTIRFIMGHPKNLSAPPKPGAFYLGTFASSRLDASAVKRNRMRRRCREALRLSLAQCVGLPAVQVLMTPRPASMTCDFADIAADAGMFLALLKRRG
ncbi:ribonuclease P protein component [Candidatus Peregrinibacteria bacterium]|nr:ribonuclease P protein component [Candidatus Peregrinibacteria bacterium]